MGGRTKRVSEIVSGALPEFEAYFSPFEINGKLKEKIKILDKFENGDFSLVEEGLNELNVEPYEYILIGMPTYGNRPPKIFDEIMNRIENFANKKVAVFTTSRFTGDGTIDYMKSAIEAKGAEVVQTHNFKGLIKIRSKTGTNFAKEIQASISK